LKLSDVTKMTELAQTNAPLIVGEPLENNTVQSQPQTESNENCGIEFRSEIQCTRYNGSITHYGPVYWGNLRLANYSNWDILLSTGKITEEEKSILIGMSENEGKLDSVQSYDSEIVTVGAMQKTVNPQRYGEFPKQMAEFKEEYPEKFKILFENCGWTVKKENNKWRAYYLDETGAILKEKIRNGFNADNFKKKVQSIPIEPLINAAKDSYFQAKQVEDFIQRLNKEVLPLRPTGYSYKISDYLKTKLGKATVLDQHINRPGYVTDDFAKSLNNFFNKNTQVSKNPNNWGDNHRTYEEEILEHYGVNRRGTDMSARFRKMKNNSYLK